MSTFYTQANAGFSGVKNVGLQASSLQSSSLVNSFDMNAIRVLKGSVPAGTGVKPLLDSEGNPILLGSTDLVMSMAYACPEATGGTGINLIGLSASSGGTITKIMNVPSGGVSNIVAGTAFSSSAPTGAGATPYVNFQFDWGSLNAPTDVSMLVLNPK